MKVINVISFTLFILFCLSYFAKLIAMKSKLNIKAYVLGKGKKNGAIRFAEVLVRISTLIWGLSWAVYPFFYEHLTNILVKSDGRLTVIIVGLVISAIGLFVFITAMLTMRDSWRVGIDKQTSTKLVTTGIYRYSRNPAFLGFDLMFTGFCLTYFSVVSVAICLVNTIALHILILQEEKHLISTIGDQYLQYMRKTRRYIGTY